MKKPDSKYNRAEQLAAFERILNIMDELRETCPWDKKQTIESLRHLTVEETYELADSIMEGDMEGIRNELGDLMLHLVFYSRIAAEEGAFDIAEVINRQCEKLIKRHPHVYGDVDIDDEQAVKENWEKIKLNEEGAKSVLGGVPASLPAMVKAIRIQEKARGVGFDWENSQQVWEKVEEEMAEFKKESTGEGVDANKDRAEDELGDLFFSLINYARFLEINPEDALEKTNRKFIRRFQFLETESEKDGKKLPEMSLEEMDAYWEKAKDL